MTMTEWASNEIKLFKERASEEDKVHAEAVASAYRGLMKDDHTGLSMEITRYLINDLIDAEEGNPGKWAEERKAKEKASEMEDDNKHLFECAVEYACACVDSAAKAYKAMLKVEKPVSGKAKELLNRLLKNQPLSPITEDAFKAALHEPHEWEVEPNVLEGKHLKSSMQCPRMFSLFREEDLDGNVTYSDVQRAIYMDQRNQAWADGEAVRTVDRMFPITLPYYPADKPFVVHGHHDGTPDVRHYDYLITPEGKRIELNIGVGEREESK